MGTLNCTAALFEELEGNLEESIPIIGKGVFLPMGVFTSREYITRLLNSRRAASIIETTIRPSP